MDNVKKKMNLFLIELGGRFFIPPSLPFLFRGKF